jgi:hypothetical protein
MLGFARSRRIATMNRRKFLGNTLAATGGALLPLSGIAKGDLGSATDQGPSQIPGSVPDADIDGARFPEGFLWGIPKDGL